MTSVLKLNNGKYKDFTCLFAAYDALPRNKQDPDIRENIKAAMIAAGINKLTPKEERELMYDPKDNWIGVIKYLEEVK